MAEPIVTMTARVEVDKQRVLEDSVAVFKDAQKIADGNAIVYKFEGDKESLKKLINEISHTEFKIGADIYIKSSAQDLQKLINEKYGQSAKIEINADTSKAEEQYKKLNKEREKAQKESSNNASSVRDLAMQQEIIDAQKKYKASVEETTKAITEQTNAERSLDQYARRVSMTSEEAFQQLGRELDNANVKTKEFEKSIKKALSATKSADSAGSSLDLLSELQQDANKTSTEMNKEAAQAYNKLKSSAKEYYDYLRKESSGTLTETERERLTDLKREWADATAAVGKYKTVAGSAASVKNLEKARSNFNESDDVIAVKYSQKLAADEKKLRDLANSGKYTQQLVKQLSDVADEIEEINSKPIDLKVDGTLENLGKLDAKISEAFDNAKIADFRKAHESSIAKLNLQIEEFMQKNSKMGADFKRQFENLKLDWDTEHTNAELEELVAKFAKLKGEVTAAGKLGASFFNTLRERAMGVNAQLIAQYLSWQDIIRYIRVAAEAVIELDSALTEMRKVSDESFKSLQEYQKLTFDIADRVGTTGLDLQKATADWMRIGESMNEASKSAEAATVLMNVSEFENIDDATKALVSASQAYKELDKMDIVDVINNIGNNYAVATDELAQGLQNSAAVLKTQGNDLYEAVALLTAGNAITQDISKVAAGTRTIALRLAGTEEAKDELVQMGEDVDDMIVGTHAKMQGLIKDYTAVASNAYKGIDILDANGNLRDTYDILLDIAKVYQEIINEDKKAGTNRAQALVESIAGKNRSNIAASILLNPDLLESAYETAKSSAGSAQEELDKYLESLEGHIKQFKNATQELFHTLIDSGMLADIIDFGTALVKILTEIVDKLGTIPSLGLGIGIRQLLLNFDKIPEASGKVAELIGDIAKASADAQKVITVDNASAGTKTVLKNLEGLEGVFGHIVDDAEKMSPATEAALKNISKLEGSFGPVEEAAGEVVETTAEIGEVAAKSSVGGVAKLGGAFKALVPILTNPLTIMAAIGVATYALYKWVDGENDRIREKISNLEDEYSSAEGELKTTNSELEKISSRIDEIEGKGTLSLVEQEELERLRTQAELLRIAAEEQERLLKAKGQELNTENRKLFDKVYAGTENATVDYTSFTADEGFDSSNPLSYYGAQLSDALEDAAKGKYNDNPEQLLQIYHTVSKAQKESIELIKKAKEEYGSYEEAIEALSQKEQSATEAEREAIQKQINDLENADAILDETSQYIDGIAANVESTKASVLKMISEAQLAGKKDGKWVNQDDIDKYNKVLKAMYELSDTANSWNALKISEMFDKGDIGTTKDELVEMAAAGESAYDLMKKFPKLAEAIGGLDLILEDGQDAWDIFVNELIATSDAAEKANESLNDTLETAKSWESERDAALEKLGLAKQGREGLEYDDSWTNYLETIKQLNPEIAKNEEEVEKCALANLQFSHAVDDLSKNFKTYKESLKDANSLTPEFSNAINALADDLTYLTGIEFSISDASDFLSDSNNLELLEKAINGSDEALQQLQAHASESIRIKIDAKSVEELRSVVNKTLVDVKKELEELGKGGNVDLTLRPRIDTQLLRDVGWDKVEEVAGEYATVFTKTFTNEAGDVAVNFTPIIVDKNGNYVDVMEPDALTEYAEAVIAGTQTDYLNLQIGAEFTGEHAVEEAEAAAVRIHNLHELQIELGLDTNEFNAQFTGLIDWLETADLGTLEAQTYLNEDPFIQALIHLANESEEMAAKIKQIFAELGWDIKWDTAKMKVPKANGSHITSTYAKDVYGNPIGQSYVRWDYEEMDVPTNIRFERTGGSGRRSSTSGYTPKSMSPSQKSNAGSNLSKGSGGGGGSSDKDTKEQEDTYKELIDYFERMIKILDQSINLLKAHLEDVVGSFAKNTLIDAQEAQIKKKMEGYSSAISMYSAKASEALSKIPSDVAANIQNGAVAIGEFVGESNKEVVEAAQEYEQWADKVYDCKLQLVELREELRQLELQKFKNVAQDFQELFDVRKTQIDLISKAISLFETARDKKVGRAFYDESIEQADKQLSKLLEKRTALTEQMASAIASGINKTVPCYSNVA